MTLYTQRLTNLRVALNSLHLNGFLIPLTDAHRNEYLPEPAKRLEYISGFSGSAGFGIVTQEQAVLFVDGRYTIQAKQQVEPIFTVLPILEMPPAKWLKENIKSGDNIGYDPWLHTELEIAAFQKECSLKGATLTPCLSNPLDLIWQERPPQPLTPVKSHPRVFSGEDSLEKRQKIAALLKQQKADFLLLTMLDSIAWLFNIRGNDIAYNPLTLAYSAVKADGSAELFINPAKLSKEVIDFLGEDIEIHPEELLPAFLKEIGLQKKVIQIDPASTPIALVDILKRAGATLLKGEDPCLLLKACKNKIEQQGMRECHLKDGIALTNFLCWLSKEGIKGYLTEAEVADKLLEFRRADKGFQDLSFPTISAAGPHAALPHYRHTEVSSKQLVPPLIYLVDSGGQYLAGTTDVTRTLVLGEATAEQKERFTRVLKGHIALITAVFPKGTFGIQLDVLARLPLWQIGLDYDHGTGHGVGSYLCVHEGPQSISRRLLNVPLQEGMVLSIEPGYYKPDHYGIRIENLALVKKAVLKESEKEMLCFENLTLAPVDKNLIDRALLSDTEKSWINQYHQNVFKKLSPFLNPETKEWLKDVTSPL